MAGEHLAQPSAAEFLKVISLYSSFHRMRLTDEERSTTSTCPASSSTSTMVNNCLRFPGVERAGLLATWAGSADLLSG